MAATSEDRTILCPVTNATPILMFIRIFSVGCRRLTNNTQILMKRLSLAVITVLFFAFQSQAQLSSATGGASSLLPNSPTSNTNVGIGTTTPTEKLEVAGKIKAETGIFSREVPNGATFSSVQERSIQCNVLSAGAMLDSSWNYRTLQFWDCPQSNIDANPVVIFNLEDRNYKSRFWFNATANSSSQLLLRDRNQNEVFKLYEDGSDNLWIHMPKPSSRFIIGGWAEYAPGLAHKLVVQNGSALIEGNILTNSNIGIGTVNFTDGADTYRLSVKGAIRAERVRVYTNWADYVFEGNYKLPTLKQVEEHINEKGHLINIPSAKEVEEKGIDLGEMNKLLLEKIEELTLYMIEMDKEIQNLKSNLKAK
jgi:hypothetical protein